MRECSQPLSKHFLFHFGEQQQSKQREEYERRGKVNGEMRREREMENGKCDRNQS